jgi:hypothetical protein
MLLAGPGRDGPPPDRSGRSAPGDSTLTPGAGTDYPVRAGVLLEAHRVGERALERLYRLRRLFPDSLPRPLLEQLGRDPARDRRRAVRLGGSGRVAVRRGAGGRSGEAEITDYCPGGLRLRLGWPVPRGAELWVRPAGAPGDGWLAVAVRHRRRDGAGWALGCEVTGVVRGEG